jgi:hypothetical protein
MNITVFTAIFGNYERVRQPRVVNPDVRYVLFTDRQVKRPGVWEVRIVPRKGCAARSARHYKILPHLYLPDADVTVWHGGWLQLIADPLKAVGFLFKNDIAMEPHIERGCIYEEAAACIRLKKVNPKNAKRQMRAYASEGFPTNYGLTSAFLIVRRNTAQVSIMSELWWKQIEKFTNRDQLSLMYCLWKCGMGYDKIPPGPSRNGLYRTHAHGK